MDSDSHCPQPLVRGIRQGGRAQIEGMTESTVLVVASPGEVLETVLATVASQGLEPRVVDEVELVPERWRSVGSVVIAADLAGRVAALALPVRPGVILVGTEPTGLTRWSAPLGAQVVGLPEGLAWLGVLLAGGAGRGAPVVAVLGGSGGVGASTLAGALAGLAASSGGAALVDIDPFGGGLDLLLGAEQVEGWRWPRLTAASGHVGGLRPYLPVVDDVALVSMARGPGLDLAREPVAAIVGSLAREHNLVVIDPGRASASAAREALRLADHVLLVVGGGVRGVAAAREVNRALGLEQAGLVWRRSGSGLSAGSVEEAIGLPVVSQLPEDRRLPVAAERGDPPLRCGRAYRRACRRLLDRIISGRLDGPDDE